MIISHTNLETIGEVDVVVVAPHPDDAELGMGGTILKMVEASITVGIVDVTNGEPTPFGTPEIRAAETEQATKILGIRWRANLGLPNRSLEPTLEGRAMLASVFRLARPKMVFCPYWEDAHPDHLATTEMAEAARFWAKLTKTDLPGSPYYPPRIYYYFCTHLRKVFVPNFVVDISDYIEKKLEVIRCYESQVIAGRPTSPYSFVESLRHRAAALGISSGVEFAEGFSSRETLVIEDLRAIGPFVKPSDATP
jgi:bacillithiol biosynthesis deacetylase BshB1